MQADVAQLCADAAGAQAHTLLLLHEEHICTVERRQARSGVALRRLRQRDARVQEDKEGKMNISTNCRILRICCLRELCILYL